MADTRIHGTIRKQVGKLFQEVERAALQPLPVERFPFFHEGKRIVHRDGHVEVAKAYYSVPPEYLGHTLWVRWDLRLVRIFNGRMEQIAVHVRQEPGRFSTQDRHIAAEKRSGVERGAVYLLGRVRLDRRTRRPLGRKHAANPGNRGCSGLARAVGSGQAARRGGHRAGLPSGLLPRGLAAADHPPTAQARRPRARDLRLPRRASDHSFLERLREAGGHVVRAAVDARFSECRVSFFFFPFHPTGVFVMNESLSSALRKLRLSGLAQTLEVRLQEAASHNLSHAEFLELILQDELTVRQERLIDRRVKAAGFRELKPLTDFEWSFNPSIKKKQVYDLACCRFIRERRDVLWMGPPGVGKSFLVQALAYEAIKQGFVVLYRSIFDVVRDFLHDEAFGGEERVLAKYLKPDLLIVDDMGMKQLPKRSGEYLFEIIMRRYETRCTMMTSNRPLEDWGKLIGDVPSATAILDRFLHHAEIITITGRSYRLRNQGGQEDEPKDNGQTNQGRKTIPKGLRRIPFCGVAGYLSAPQSTVTLPNMNPTGWF